MAHMQLVAYFAFGIEHKIYWNFTSNYSTDVFEVELYDSITFLCPATDNDFSIYEVHDIFHVNFTTAFFSRKIVNCSSAHHFTILYTEFTSLPGGIDYKVGQFYSYLADIYGGELTLWIREDIPIMTIKATLLNNNVTYANNSTSGSKNIIVEKETEAFVKVIIGVWLILITIN